jgi:hypothetical protein
MQNENLPETVSSDENGVRASCKRALWQKIASNQAECWPKMDVQMLIHLYCLTDKLLNGFA